MLPPRASWITVDHCLPPSPQGYREDDGLVLESDTDEQLLIHINFSQAVRLSGIVIKSTVGDAAPKTVKLFVNQPTIGFGGELPLLCCRYGSARC